MIIFLVFSFRFSDCFPLVPLLDHLCSALLHPDEALKTSLVYVWLQLLEAPGGTAAQFLSTATRERLCVLLLQTFDSAGSEKLIRNCAGEK